MAIVDASKMEGADSVTQLLSLLSDPKTFAEKVNFLQKKYTDAQVAESKFKDFEKRLGEIAARERACDDREDELDERSDVLQARVHEYNDRANRLKAALGE